MSIPSSSPPSSSLLSPSSVPFAAVPRSIAIGLRSPVHKRKADAPHCAPCVCTRCEAYRKYLQDSLDHAVLAAESCTIIVTRPRLWTPVRLFVPDSCAPDFYIAHYAIGDRLCYDGELIPCEYFKTPQTLMHPAPRVEANLAFAITVFNGGHCLREFHGVLEIEE